MTGKEYFEQYKVNPDKIKFDGNVYTESDLAGMDSEDYNEVMEFGTITEEESELIMIIDPSDKRINDLVNKEFVTEEELQEIRDHERIIDVENCGNSGKYYGYTWYNIITDWNEEYSVYVKQ
jgi:hypothetical protein